MGCGLTDRIAAADGGLRVHHMVYEAGTASPADHGSLAARHSAGTGGLAYRPFINVRRTSSLLSSTARS